MASVPRRQRIPRVLCTESHAAAVPGVQGEGSEGREAREGREWGGDEGKAEGSARDAETQRGEGGEDENGRLEGNGHLRGAGQAGGTGRAGGGEGAARNRVDERRGAAGVTQGGARGAAGVTQGRAREVAGVAQGRGDGGDAAGVTQGGAGAAGVMHGGARGAPGVTHGGGDGGDAAGWHQPAPHFLTPQPAKQSGAIPKRLPSCPAAPLAGNGASNEASNGASNGASARVICTQPVRLDFSDGSRQRLATRHDDATTQRRRELRARLVDRGTALGRPPEPSHDAPNTPSNQKSLDGADDAVTFRLGDDDGSAATDDANGHADERVRPGATPKRTFHKSVSAPVCRAARCDGRRGADSLLRSVVAKELTEHLEVRRGTTRRMLEL